MTAGLNDLEALWRQAAIDAANPQSRLKIAGSLPQTRLVQALYRNAEAIIAGLKAVDGLVDHMDQLHAAINEILDEAAKTPDDQAVGAIENIRDKINTLFGNEKPANDMAKAKLKVVKP